MEPEYTNRREAVKENQDEFRKKSRSTRFVKTMRSQKRTSSNDASLSMRLWRHKDAQAAFGTVTLLGALGVYGVFFAPSLAVQHVSVNDTSFVSHDDIYNAALGAIQTPLWHIVPQNRLVLLNKSHLESETRAALGQPFAIESMQIDKQWGGNVSIIVKERIPGVTWVTKDTSGREYFYTLDRNGVITEEFQSKDQIRKNIPIVYDKNREVLGLNWHVMSSSYIDAVVALADGMNKMSIPIESFELPSLVCKEQQYVAEKIFADEIANSESESTKTKKRNVQEQFKSGKLDIDQSLAALEEIKKEEEAAASNSNMAMITGNDAITWATVNKEIDCDFVTVASDVNIVLPKDDAVWRGIKIKMDTKRSIEEQLRQLEEGLRDAVPADKTGLQYIDVRIPDRIYYK